MAADPKRGEVWRVDLDPTVGSEIQKSRPCVVVSADDVGRLPLRVVVPLTGWTPAFDAYPWCVRIAPTSTNGLAKVSSADTFQMRAVSVLRMTVQLGVLTDAEMKSITQAILVCVDYEP